MKKSRFREDCFYIIKLIVVLPVLLTSTSQVFSQNPVVKQTHHYLRAPDVIPGTLPEMRDSSYWIARMKQPDEVVMTQAGIQKMNADFIKRMNDPGQIDTVLVRAIREKIESSPGLFAAMPDLYGKSPQDVAAIARSQIQAALHYLQKGEFGNILAIQYSSTELRELESEMTCDNIAEAIKIQSGITVEDIQLRIIPLLRPEYIGLLDKNKTRWDVFNLDIVPMASPVVIMHASASGQSLFVLSANGYGWVSSDKIALASRQQIAAFTSGKKFAVCTGDRVPFYAAADCRYGSGSFRMGDKLPFSGHDRTILVPTRQMNGQLLVQKAWLRKDAEISHGFLPFTRRHIVDQSFKLLDRVYDWTGAWFGRNHATVLRDVFACFGFTFPSSGELLSVYNSGTTRMFAKEGKEKQYSIILAHEPFVTVQITGNGHSQLYLGDYLGEPIVFDTHGYGYTDAEGQDLEIRRACIGTMSLPNYFLKQDVNFLTLAPVK